MHRRKNNVARSCSNCFTRSNFSLYLSVAPILRDILGLLPFLLLVVLCILCRQSERASFVLFVCVTLLAITETLKDFDSRWLGTTKYSSSAAIYK